MPRRHYGSRSARPAQSHGTEAGRQDAVAHAGSLADAIVGLYRASVDGEVLDANATCLDLLGYPGLDTLRKVDVREVFADPTAGQSLLEALARDGVAADVECAVRRYGGDVVWVRLTARLVRSPDGAAPYVEGALVDITDRVRAEEQARWRAARFETLNAITSSAVAATNIESLFEFTIDSALKTLRADAGHMWTLTTSVLRGMSREVGTSLRAARLATGADPYGARAVNDWAAHPPAGSEQLAAAVAAGGFCASMRAPILAGDRPVGGVVVLSVRPRAWAPDELQLIEAIGRQIGAAVHRLQQAEVTRRTAELEAFCDLGRRLREARGEQDMYPIVVEHARELVNADQGALAFASPEKETFTVAYTAGIEKERPGWVFGAQPVHSGLVLRTGTTFVTPNFSAEVASPWPEGTPYHLAGPLVIVPVRSEEQVIGTLRMARWNRPGVLPFTDAEVRLVEGCAEIAGTAIRRARLHSDLERAYLDMVLTLARTVDARDRYTSNHSEVIASRAVRLARALGCADEEVRDIEWAARLHDIGKLSVPDDILQKPGPLSPSDWEIMRQHPVVGSEILRPVERMAHVARLVRAHQERWDGTGYPDGLRGDGIPLGARILAVVDAYSAILDDRAYARARTPGEALEELRRCAGAQFDPAIVDAFCHMLACDDPGRAQVDAGTPGAGAAAPVPAPRAAPSAATAPRVKQALPALTDLAKRLLRPLDLPTVLDEILRQIQEVFGYSLCGVFFIDEETQELYVMAQRGFAAGVAQWRFPIGERGIVGWVARHKRAYYAPDVVLDPYYVAAFPDTRSDAAFPLIVDDRIIGVLNVESPAVDAFPKENREVLEAFAILAGLAILRAQRDDDLTRLALTDGLTGLANRRALWEALEREIARGQRESRPVSVLVIEVDRFKYCNDVLGHLEGDRVLRAIADSLRANSRAMDMVARFGGDEFVILLADTDAGTACQIAERARARIAELMFARPAQITVSIGLATTPQDGMTGEALIEAADQRMYEAKRAGGNCVRVA